MNNKICRRGFLKVAGVTAASAGLASCGVKKEESVAPAMGEVPKDKMTYRKTNKGVEVGLLGYGSRWPMLKTPAPDGNILDQEAVNDLVDYAIEHGVNYFNTAPAYSYGWCETTVGNALKRHPREKFLIGTKLSNYEPRTFSREASLKMYYDSFKYLHVDYFDFYFIHGLGFGTDTPIPTIKARIFENGMLDFLKSEREAGRIRHLGYSFHGDKETFDYLLSLHEEANWDFVMIQMNYLDWKYGSQGTNRNPTVDAIYAYDELTKRGISVFVMEPLLGGRLVSVPDYVAGRLKQAEPTKSIASWGFRFVGSFPNVLCVLSGMNNHTHLQDNIRTFSPLVPLEEKGFELLDESAKMIMDYDSIPCNDCKYCVPCPYGIDIPAILLHYNKCIFEGRIIEDSNDPDYKKARREFLIGYDRTAPKLRQADHCTGCGDCVKLCPQGIDIISEFRKINNFVEKLRADL